MLSIIIPSRNEKFLQKTIDHVLLKARGEIEVIVSLDGYWPNPQLTDHPAMKIVHSGEAMGVRHAINAGVAASKGEYIMKLDAHCMVDEGFDIKLTADLMPDWVVIPRRKRLDADNWCLRDVGKPDVDYEYLSFPEDPKDWGGPGLNGKIWPDRGRQRAHLQIDEQMSFQGSCYVMYRSYFDFLELMNRDQYGPFANEAQEIGMKAWLSGGKVMVNKKTWYAHLHKGKVHGRGYFMPKSWFTIGSSYTKKWMLPVGTAWHKQTIPLSWLIEHFMPCPSWDEAKLARLKRLEAGETTEL